MKLSQLVQEVIRLSNVIGNYWDTELRKRLPDYPIMRPGEDEGPPSPEEQTLRELLEGLPEDTLYKLALLMYLGHGRFGTDHLAAEYMELKETFGPRDEAVAVLAGDYSLGYYLSRGLEELKKAGIDVDKMNLKRAVSETAASRRRRS